MAHRRNIGTTPVVEGVDPEVSEPRYQPRRAWTITALLFVFFLINWGDKAVLGLTAAPMMREMGLSPAQYGLAASAIYFLFSISGAFGGFLANRVKAKWLMAGMAVIWSLTQLPMLFSTGFAVLIACRVVLGAAEGPAAPVALHGLMKWFPDTKRNMPNSVFLVGASLGVVVAAPGLAWVTATFGWRWAFGAMGIIGLVWVVVWWLFGAEGPFTGAQPSRRDQEGAAVEDGFRVPYRRVFTSGTWLGATIGTFAVYWGIAVTVTWLPVYLEEGLGYGTLAAGNVVALTALIGAGALFGQGLLAHVLMARGGSSRWARGGVGGGAAILAALTLLVGLQIGGVWHLVLVAVGLQLGVAITAATPPAIGEIVPVAQRGGALGMHVALQTSAGILAPYVTGRIVSAAADPVTGFHTAFAVAAGIMLVGGAVAAIFMRPQRDAARLGVQPPTALPAQRNA
ncbi:MFS transporter [Saccharopolyspora sp. NPDC050389]|uniref:MFS transporter n=1 Tax=Saccharopolyspora sp. NPDC050389 TaxID=3155516 RepID=UPI0033DDC305